MGHNHTIEVIKSRRSIRNFLDRKVEDGITETILEAARWAPSGLNNQPWRFVVVTDRGIAEKMADCTRYGQIIRHAPLLIAVFLDLDMMYDRTKDVQACGAAIQNILLAAHSMGLGAVWLGEILNCKTDVGNILDAPESFELMAVIAIGYPAKEIIRSKDRLPLSDIAFSEKFGVPWK